MILTVKILKGLPASGKSTYAKKLVDTENYVRLNKDDLRAMLFNDNYKGTNEKMVLNVRNQIILESLKRNRNVVVDDTNLNPIHVTNITNLVEKLEHVIVEIIPFDVDINECIDRDKKRKIGKVGKGVIMGMYNQYIRKTENIPYDESLKNCIIVDIDGTLAKANGRNHYDMTKVSEDLPVDHIITLVQQLESLYFIVVFSGRSDDCEKDTRKWLINNQVPFDQLQMRKFGDMRKDSIIKKELFDKYIRNKFNCAYVIDDRNQVVDMWRNDLGLPCIQVADGNF